MKLKSAEIKEIRAKLVRKQGYKCPLCREKLNQEDAVLDHCHITGHIRKALHRSCNAAEGRILHWAGVRSRGEDPVEFVSNLLKYWKADYSQNPIHHTHGRIKRKRKKKPRMKRTRYNDNSRTCR